MTVRLIRWIITAISRLSLPAARRCGRWLGYWAWRLDSRGTQTARINLRHCFPDMDDREREALVRRSMAHWGMTVFEVPGVWRRGLSGLRHITAIEGEEIFRRAIDAGKGVIVVVPHHGNWEMVGLWLSTRGPITSLYQPARIGELDDIMHRGRTSGGATLVPTNMRGISSLIKALRRGELTGILPDMEPEAGSGEFAPFFGVPALTMTLVHNLIQRSGATAVMGFCQRTDSGFTLHLTEPPPAIHDADTGASLVALNQAIEQLVLLAPEQYQWEYKRFKRRPAGEAKIYPKG